MSWEALSWAWPLDVGTAGRKALLIALADAADEWGTGYRGQESLSIMTCQSRRSVSAHFAWLEENGYLTRSKRFREDGTRTSDYFHLQMSPRAGSATGKSCRDHVQISPSPCADSSTEPSEEPSEEPSVENPSAFTGSKAGANQSVKTSGSEPEKEPRRPFDAATMETPWHLEHGLWSDFVNHRRELRAPLTERAARIILNKLARARDANDALEAAITNGWKGVFPKDMSDTPLPAPTSARNVVRLRRGSIVELLDGTRRVVEYHETSTGLLELEGGAHAQYEDVKIIEEAE